MRTRLLAGVVVAASSALLAAESRAEVVMFDNSAGAFPWTLQNDQCPACNDNHYLDITSAPNAQQTAHIPGRTFVLSHHYIQWNQRSGYVVMTASCCGAALTHGDCFAWGVPPSAEMQARVGPWASFSSCGWVAHLQDPAQTSVPSALFLTDDFVGLRILIDDQPHFGWVEVRATITSPLDYTARVTVAPLRWAYETRPNVPIAIPGRCLTDLDSDGLFSNGGTPDSAVTIDDLLFFLAAFEAGDVAGDLDSDGDPAAGTPDGAVTIEDLLFFLARFEQGC